MYFWILLYYMGEFVRGFDFGYTGIKRDLHWPRPSPVKQEAEKALLYSSILIQRGEYCDGDHLPDKRKEDIERECRRYGMTLDQALSLRKQALVTKVVLANKKIRPRITYLVRSFHDGRNILELSAEVDLPPMSIMRAILTRRVKNNNKDMHDRDVKKIVKREIYDGQGEYIWSLYEEDQLKLAKIFDQTSYSDPSSLEKDLSAGWEVSLHDFLNQNEVSYLTEATLRDELHQQSTPDVLFLDDVSINGIRVRWIDSKNFFGGIVSSSTSSTSSSSSPSSGHQNIKENEQGGHFIKKLTKQIAKYDTAYQAHGAIVYRLGYSESLRKLVGSQTLLLDKGPLHAPMVSRDSRN